MIPPVSSTLLRGIVLAVISGAFLAYPVAAQTVRYTVTDLGALTVRAINDSGQLTGALGNKAVLYTDGVIKDITPTGGRSATGSAINNLGHVVGSVFFCDIVDGNCVNGKTYGFIYADGKTTVLGTLGGRDSYAIGINDRGYVVGASTTSGTGPNNSGPNHAFIYKDGTFEDIGARLGARTSAAQSINSLDQVAGNADSNAFIYRDGTASFLQPLGTVIDINNRGQLVGVFGVNHDGSGRAFLYSNGMSQDLGTLSNQHRYSIARAVNDAGQVVGYSNPSFLTQSDKRAFIYDGDLQDLNSLVPGGSGWVLSEAKDINDAGQIVGNGLLNGQERNFLLTPVKPLLLTEPGSEKALALDSVTFMRDPFSDATSHNFSSDHRTRVVLFARHVELASGETASAVTVRAEDAQRRTILLPVEYVGKVPRFSWLTQVVVRLPDDLSQGGDVQVSITLRGHSSNKSVISIKPSATSTP